MVLGPTMQCLNLKLQMFDAHYNVMKGAFRQQVSLVLPYWCMQADKKSFVFSISSQSRSLILFFSYSTHICVEMNMIQILMLLEQ